MRKPILSTLTALAIVGCSSPRQTGESVSTQVVTQEEITATAATETATATCPTFYGKYSREEYVDSVRERRQVFDIYVLSKEEAGVTSYSFQENQAFIPADGIVKPVDNESGKGTVRIGCKNEVLIIEDKKEGETAARIFKYSSPKSTELREEKISVDGTSEIKTYIQIRNAEEPAQAAPEKAPEQSEKAPESEPAPESDGAPIAQE